MGRPHLGGDESSAEATSRLKPLGPTPGTQGVYPSAGHGTRLGSRSTAEELDPFVAGQPDGLSTLRLAAVEPPQRISDSLIDDELAELESFSRYLDGHTRSQNIRRACERAWRWFSVTTIRQHLAGIADRHLSEGHQDPTGHRGVSDLVSGLCATAAIPLTARVQSPAV